MEIGCGRGILTQELSKKVKQLIVIEIDKDCIEATQEELKDHQNITFINKDFIRSDLTTIDEKPYQIIANIPYHISAKIVQKIIVQQKDITRAILMVQKEFAEKLIAKPNQKDYTPLSLYSQYHLDIKKLFNVSKNCFYPIPKVESCVIELTPRSTPLFGDIDEELLFKLIKGGFWGKRKFLVNSLQKNPYIKLSKEIENAPLFQKNPTLRAANLSLADYYELLSYSIQSVITQ